MKTLLNLNDDEINRSIINGLTDQFKRELVAELRVVAEDAIEAVAEALVDRLKIKLSDHTEFETLDRTIKLELLLNGEKVV